MKHFLHFKDIISLLIFVVLLNFNIEAKAQQTVFSVPSADVTPKGRLFLEQESSFRGWGEDAFFTSTTIGAYGIGHNTDLDVTLFNVGAPATHNIALATGFKTSIPIAKERLKNSELKITVGDEILTSLQKNGVGNWTYVNFSGRLPKIRTRLTAGVSYGTKQVFGTDNVAFIGAIEQPITKKLTLITDWYSGKEHWAGYLITGFSYSFPKDKTLYVGYQIPNTPNNGVSGFVIEFSKMY